MPKFHDEFFRKGSVDHDALVALTIEKSKEIFDIIIPKTGLLSNGTSKIFLCNAENNIPLWCSLQGTRAHTICASCISFYGSRWGGNPSQLNIREEAHKCTCFDFKKIPEEDLGKYINSLTYDTTKDNNKLFFPDFIVNTADNLFIDSIFPHSTTRNCEQKQSLHGFIPKVETEKICKSGNFIVGYADVVFTFHFNIKTDLIISESWTWKNFSDIRKKLLVVVECKPVLKSWGGPLRQIKTYMDILRDDSDYLTRGIITTFSDVSEEYKKILAAENVFVVTFPKKKGKLLEDYGAEKR